MGDSMLVSTDAIRVEGRCRKDLGDIGALASSIADVGLLHPVVVTADMALVAGERRLSAVRQLGWAEVPVTVTDSLPDAAALLRAERDENTARKELAPTEAVALGERLAALLRPQAEARARTRTDLMSDDCKATFLPETGQTRDAVGDAVGMSGRTWQKAQAVVKAAEEHPEKFAPLAEQMDATGKVDKAYNALKRDLQKEKDAEAALAVQDVPDKWRVIHAPIADLATQLGPASVDAIVTDPPYPEEFLDTYDTLGELAAEVLKPGGSLLVMVGQAHLPEVLRRMGASIRYHWCMSYTMPGATAKMWGRKVIVGWKPILWFVNGETWEPPSGLMPVDVATSDRRDKDHHHWGQSEGGMADLIEKVTRPGDTVLDPFCGGGTTGTAAVKVGRLFIGADIDEAAVNRTRVRLGEVV
jgi:ParB-like chromosome segregation protein Spo0J